MKKILAVYFLPALLALLTLLGLVSATKLNNFLFERPTTEINSKNTCIFIENFRDNPECESQFLKSNDSTANIFLLGSSELTGATEATPYNFISAHFNIKLKAVGHAGNQCFSIYSQLLANENRLKNAPVIIVLSPMWFLSKEAEGTSSTIFLEFNSDSFLNRIIQNDSIEYFKKYQNKRISEMFPDFSSPNVALKHLHFEHQAGKSVIHNLVYTPICLIDNLILDFKLHEQGETSQIENATSHPQIVPENITFNWDSIYTNSKMEFMGNSTNNQWGIDNEYYSKYIQGRTGGIVYVPEGKNKELQDFRMLLELLQTKRANASFIIIPMNPYFYLNLKEASPIINTINNEISNAGFPCLNYWVDDSLKYEKGILRDIMHLSSYGWYKADRFIVETYQLTK